jgi:acetyl-CoA carboxylase biotin carboxyl carrier protein
MTDCTGASEAGEGPGGHAKGGHSMTVSDEDAVQRHDTAHADLLGAIARELAALAANLPGALRRVSVTAAGHGVEVEWETRDTAGTAPATVDPPVHVPDAALPVTGAGLVPAEHPGRLVVRAPLVGTFYRAPQPGAPAFVTPGDAVEEGETLGIVEAMKLMNHVTADRAGRVVEILAGEGEPVEYDQPLMVLETLSPEASA